MNWKSASKFAAAFVLLFSICISGLHVPFNGPSVASAAGEFHVEDFGAKGDGRTDDTKWILKAISAAGKAGGGTVVFDDGIYIINGFIDVPAKVSVRGQGMTATTLKRIDNKDERILSLKGDQVLQDIGFDSRIGILPVGDNIVVKNVKFTCRTQGIQMSLTVNNFTVIDSLFDGSGYGILSNKAPSYDVEISNSIFRNNTSDDIEINSPSERWLIEDCVFQNNMHTKDSYAGFGVGVAMRAKDITVNRSSFTNIIGQGIHVEAHSQILVKNSSFQNNGSVKYKGNPKADIAVLSDAKAEIVNCMFYASEAGYSKLAIHSAGKPNPGTVRVVSSKFYDKQLSVSVASALSSFLPPAKSN